MPQNGMIYRVLIASPSDCVKERTAIPEIIHSWNSVHSYTTNTILEPVMWETHVYPALGDRPQAIINKQIVDSCDLVIGAFWTRIGTSTGDYISGTAEEIERLRSQGKHVFLYFSLAPITPDDIDHEQHEALKEYKKSLKGQGITFDYLDVTQFRGMVQQHLSSLMASITKYKQPIEPEDDKKKSEIEMYKLQFQTFLRKFEAEWYAERNSKPHTTDEAKFIVQTALDDLLDYYSQIELDSENQLGLVFTGVFKTMKELIRHKILMDGGQSTREFWEKGDLIIELLYRIPPGLSALAFL